jgi:Flp pilus assembly protein TadG
MMDNRTVHTRPWRRRTRQLGDDTGGVSVELAILFPIVLILLLSIVQAGMWWHARNLTLTAAHAGLEAGRTTTGTTDTAHTAATTYLDRAGSGAATDPAVAVSVSATTMRVEVSATALRVLPIPGLQIRVTQVAQGPRERFTTPGQDSSP